MTSFLSRILYFTYPALIFAVSFLGWASAHQSTITALNLPPLGGEFVYSKSPLVAQYCEQENKFSLNDRKVCKSTDKSKNLNVIFKEEKYE